MRQSSIKTQIHFNFTVLLSLGLKVKGDNLEDTELMRRVNIQDMMSIHAIYKSWLKVKTKSYFLDECHPTVLMLHSVLYVL